MEIIIIIKTLERRLTYFRRRSTIKAIVPLHATYHLYIYRMIEGTRRYKNGEKYTSFLYHSVYTYIVRFIIYICGHTLAIYYTIDVVSDQREVAVTTCRCYFELIKSRFFFLPTMVRRIFGYFSSRS